MEEHGAVRSLGTDPAAVDTDGDGYEDGEEVEYGSDPLDDEDRIYIGGWPYNPNDQVPVLADTDLELHDWIDVQSYPVLNLLDEEMTLQVYSDSGPYAVLNALHP